MVIAKCCLLKAAMRRQMWSARWWYRKTKCLWLRGRGRSSQSLRLLQMNRARKEKLRDQLDLLDPHEHAQVFAVIKHHTESYTKTQTGVLVSSEVLSDSCMMEMEKMVAFYLDQRKRMDADDVVRKTMVKNG